MANKKSEMLKALMRHKENVRMFKEASSSKIGSTSRAKAARVLSIMKKLQGGQDGQGGPGTSYMQPLPQIPPLPEQPATGITIFHKLPPMKIHYGTKKPDAQGGPGMTSFTLPPQNSGITPFTLPPQNPLGSFGSAGNTSGAMTLPNGQLVGSNPNSIVGSYPNLGGIGNLGSISTTPASNDPGVGLSSNAPYTPPSTTFTPSSPSVAPITSSFPSLKSTFPVISAPPVIKAATVTSTPTPHVNSGIKDMGNGTYQYTNKDGTIHQGLWGDNYVDNTVPSSSPSSTQNNLGFVASNSNGISAADALSKIANHESGGNAQIVGDLTHYGTNGQLDPALGKYQILLSNWNNWAKAAGVDPAYQDGSKWLTQQNGKYTFLMPEAIQDQVASHQYNQYLASTNGDPYAAVQKWNPGMQNYSDIVLGSSGKYIATNNAVQGAVDESMGPSMYAWNQMSDPNNPITGGLSVGAAFSKNYSTLWDKYDLGNLSAALDNEKNTQVNLPADTASYIRGRDVAVNDSTAKIKDLQAKLTATSDPTTQVALKQQLDSLYVMRGAQTQSYIGYINTAIDQENAKVTNLTNEYNTKMAAFQNDVAQNNSATQATYTQYSAALADLYNSVADAPTRAANLQELNAEVLKANYDAAQASIPATTTLSDDVAKLQKDGVIQDSKGFLIPGTDLVDTIHNLIGDSTTPGSQPDVSASSIIQYYLQSINNSLAADSTAKTDDGALLDSSHKLKIGKDAIDQLASVWLEAMSVKDANGQPAPRADVAQLATTAKEDIVSRLGSAIGASNSTNDTAAQQIAKAIGVLKNGVGGFVGMGKHTPTQQEFVDNFVKTVTALAGGVSTADLARAIWFQYAAHDDTEKPKFVNSYLTEQQSTTNRGQLRTTDSLMQEVGYDYANYMATNAFNLANTQVPSTMSQ